jgi:predicted nucleic-acid-binding protein
MSAAIDTNIVVRFLTQDDEQQYQQAYAMFQHQQIYIPNTVFLETAYLVEQGT